MLNKTPNIAIDLFSGVGGLTCGLSQAGFNVLAGVEIDNPTATIYQKNHQKTKIYISDITKIDPAFVMQELKLKKTELTLLAGCPPCQGFSSLRTRNKSICAKDNRNDLIFEFIRWVEVFLPKHILIENVPPLAKDKRIQKILLQLKKRGYIINENTVRIENVADYGVPQRRRRMVLFCSRKKILSMPIKIKKNTVRDAISHLPSPKHSNDILHSLPVKRTDRIVKLISKVPKNGGSRSDIPKNLWLECHKRYPQGFQDVYGRMHWDRVSPTITGGCVNPSKGRFLHPEQNRAITLREASILQGFPEDYRFPISTGKEKLAKMIGNAVPPRFAKVFAKALINN